MSEIEDGLFLAGIEAAEDHDWLASKQISHVLTCDLWEQNPKRENVHYKFIEINDVPWEDVLHKFDECYEFIETVRKSDGQILVHCQMGMSRSAAVVCAYLMRKHRIGVKAALDRIKTRRPFVQPNPGFMLQLELYEKMGLKIDAGHPEYKRFVLKQLVQGQKSKPDHLPATVLLSDPENQPEEAESVIYKCRKCRRPLFRSDSVMRHTIGQNERLYYMRQLSSRRIKKADGDSEESEENLECKEGLYVLPIQWMVDQIDKVEGKVNCPKCQAKLGTFCWAGMQCQCKAWITPAVHIQPGKIDECRSVQQPSEARPNSENPSEESKI